ncbi:hypothetical protein UK23_21385 [Lentzea aerocolonigenes]|uniref:Uncharacterized protein n=1 Tax=Lentzea aerocolonigenes TaxID=68170 RepID=A0A0F0GYQ4_LENAE|nr:hypothetical protein [Lentzea aerocolonigenes]KJK47137.1 hypothetical protein UK23_21385 [Lentzea aerocolonigenes]
MKYGNQGNTGTFGRFRRRLLRAGIAAALVLGSIGAATVPASAAQTCTGATDANLCLAIDRLPNGLFAVHVGIDVHMSFEDAQEYIDDPGDPFILRIRGDDSGKLAEFLFSAPITSLGASPEFGLSANFDTVVSSAQLDEDRNDQDEIRAEVLLFDSDTNTVTGRFVSNRITGNWS